MAELPARDVGLVLANAVDRQMGRDAALSCASRVTRVRGNNEAVARLEAEHTSLLVRQRFDAATLDAMDEPPAWLEPLLMHKHWRRLLISLLEVNPGCLFLRLAVRQVRGPVGGWGGGVRGGVWVWGGGLGGAGGGEGG
mgnify:CR=1 FL=1